MGDYLEALAMIMFGLAAKFLLIMVCATSVVLMLFYIATLFI